MATTFDLFYLGTAPQIDTVEGNLTSENHQALEGLVFGSTTDPLAGNVATLSPDVDLLLFPDYTGGATSNAYDSNNFLSNEEFVIGGVRYTHDATMLYSNTVITYTDGTTATVTAMVMQDTVGNLYLLPPPSGPTAYSLALEAKPILSVTLGTAVPANGTDVYGMTADRYDLTFSDYVVEGTSGSDMIDANYTGDPEGDRIDSADNLAGSNDDLVTAGLGNDTVRAAAGNDTVFGEGGDDLLDGGAGDDFLDGGDGNDTLDGGTGADTLIGGTGLDIVDYSGSDAAVNVDLSTGTASGGDATGDVINNGIDGFIGSAFDDTLVGYDGIFDGGATTNYIDGGAGNDSIDGRDGADTLVGGSGSDTILGGGGDDTILYGTGNDSVEGGAGNDFIDDAPGFDSTADASTVSGGDGNDTIFGSSSDDVLRGDAGDDSIGGESGNDLIDGGTGSDTIFGNAGNDTILTSGGNDSIHAGDDADLIRVSATDPSGVYNFFVDGGSGGVDNDTLDLSALIADGWTITSMTQNPETNGNPGFSGQITLSRGAEAVNINYVDIENIVIPDFIVEGTDGADLIDVNYTGDPEGDRIDNNDAADGSNDDLVFAGLGNDTVLGGAGNDEIHGGAGDDSVEGGAGDDTLFGAGGNDTLAGGDGNDRMEGFIGSDSLSGGAGDDFMFAAEGDDLIVMADDFGNDTIDGWSNGAGGDTLDAGAVTQDTVLDLTAGEPGNPEQGTLSNGTQTAQFSEIENIILGSGNDQVLGSSGNDSVSTGAGADTVDGGAGDDRFDIGAGDGAVDTVVFADGDGADTITGFEAPIDNGDGTYTGRDQLDLSGLTDANGDPVNVADVAVSDDGSGNAVLGFPNGESLTLIGVDPASVTGHDALAAMGIVQPDYVVEGTAGDDTIDSAYTGDPEGDRVDNADSRTNGDDDVIDAGAGNDLIFAGQGDDLVLGGEGADTVRADEGDDTVLGGAGNDELFGFEGSDSIDGGDGDDLINTRTSPGTGVPDRGVPGSFAGDADATNDRDTAIGGAGDDTILTGDDNDFIDGGIGADSIDAGFDDDTILGGDDNDTIIAGEGRDSVEGGSGDDLIYGDDPFGLTASLILPDDSDPVTDNGIDTLRGGDGNDTIFGLDDADLIFGDAGNDSLDGGIDADTLFGGAGDDTIHVSQGDSAEGGDGDDTFLLSDLGETETGTITIIGGEGGETVGDTLRLTPDIDRADITFTNTDDTAGGLSGTFVFNGTVVNFSEIENIICFTPGARILTPRGERAIETLRPGDLVITRDHGPQPVRWTARRTVPGTGNFAPVEIAPSVMGGRGLLVSPQHRVLFTGYRAELLFGEDEVLVAAKHLVNGRDVRITPCAAVTYIHIMFDRHEVIHADGIATESFFAGDTALSAVEDAAREELFAIFPELRSAPGRHREAARTCLKAREAALLQDRPGMWDI